MSRDLWHPNIHYREDFCRLRYNVVKVNLCFGGIYRLHLQSQTISQARNQLRTYVNIHTFLTLIYTVLLHDPKRLSAAQFGTFCAPLSCLEA
jgi:hypothetical protein